MTTETKPQAKPQYRTLVKALDELRRQVDGSVLGALGQDEIRDSYQELFRASEVAEDIVRRAKLHMKQQKEPF